MSKKYWSNLAAALALGLAAQTGVADVQLPEPGAKPKARRPAAPKPADKAKAKPAAAEPLAAIPLTPGPAVVRERNANVRGQAAINSEVVARLKKGDQVMVIEEVTLQKPKTDEPAKWAKIALPPEIGVWVHSGFIDPNTKTVVPNRLNLRSGPGENYSILGRLDKGTPVKEIEAKDVWLKIEAPTNAYAFVASHLLMPQPAAAPEPSPTLAQAEPPKPAVTPETPITPPSPAPDTPPTAPPTTPVTPVEPVTAPPTPVPTEPVTPMPTEPVTPPVTPAPAEPAPAPATTPATPPVTPPSPEPVIAVTPPTPEAPAPPPEEEIKRIVTREGIVRRSVSIQAPTYFVLESLDTGRAVNYLFSATTNIALRDFRGQRIIVTGEELLDERWPNTPVITVDQIQLAP